MIHKSENCQRCGNFLESEAATTTIESQYCFRCWRIIEPKRHRKRVVISAVVGYLILQVIIVGVDFLESQGVAVFSGMPENGQIAAVIGLMLLALLMAMLIPYAVSLSMKEWPIPCLLVYLWFVASMVFMFWASDNMRFSVLMTEFTTFHAFTAVFGLVQSLFCLAGLVHGWIAAEANDDLDEPLDEALKAKLNSALRVGFAGEAAASDMDEIS